MRSIETERLLLREWRDSDLEPYAAINADPRVMEYFPSTLTREESDAQVARIRAHWEKNGFGVFAVEIPGIAENIGFIGLIVPRFEAAFTPCVEIGWRIAHERWGKGYATEGARACLELGFHELGLEEIVSMTVPSNTRSRRVMEKLGFRYAEGEDFDHPQIADGSPLKRHVLYRLPRP